MRSFQVFRMKYSGSAVFSALSMEVLRKEDIPSYIAVYNACFRPMREALECSPTDFYYTDDQIQEKQEQIFVWKEAGEIAGSVAIYDHEIDDLIVNPAWQGRGLGRALLTWAVARMQADGTEPITLSVVDWNRRAVCLYQNFGFIPFETLQIGSKELL